MKLRSKTTKNYKISTTDNVHTNQISLNKTNKIGNRYLVIFDNKIMNKNEINHNLNTYYGNVSKTATNNLLNKKANLQNLSS